MSKTNLALVHDSSASPLTPEHLSDHGGEPRIRDLAMAERLGFAEPRMIRKLIERNAGELRGFGELALRDGTPITCGKGRVIETKEYWLNEGQALVICALSRTPQAATVRKQIIEVFLAYRAGKLQPVAHALPADATAGALIAIPAELLNRIASALDQLASERPAPAMAIGAVAVAERDVNQPDTNPARVDECDMLDRFVAAHVRPCPGGRLQSSVFYRAFELWCEAEGYVPPTQNKFGRMLTSRIERVEGAHFRYYLDVKLEGVTEPPPPAAEAPRAALPRPTLRTRPALPPADRKGPLLCGVAAIAAHLGLSVRRAKHNVAIGAIPTFKMGRNICSSIETLDAWVVNSPKLREVRQ